MKVVLANVLAALALAAGAEVCVRVEPSATVAQKDGKTGVLVTRYTDDDNLVSPATVRVALPKGAFGGIVRGFVTDGFHAGSAKTFLPEGDGSLILSMLPNSFVYIEVEAR